MIGREITAKLGRRVVVANGTVVNVSRDKSVSEFLARYLRWSVIHQRRVERPDVRAVKAQPTRSALFEGAERRVPKVEPIHHVDPVHLDHR